MVDQAGEEDRDPLLLQPCVSSTDILNSEMQWMKKNRVLTMEDHFWQAVKSIRIKKVCEDTIGICNNVCNNVERQPSTP